MSPETSEITSEFTTAADNYVINFNETELTLGLPGESRRRKLKKKRRFSDLKSSRDEYSDTECSDATKHPPIEELVVGWPPVALRRKNVMNSNFRFVKVAVDGAPYLRKLDLESCSDYEQLHCALKEIFSYFTVENALIMKRLMDVVIVNGITIRYVSTYEDEDGDWMLVGDVPWRMFVRTCKRIRLMKSSDAINGLAS